MRKPTGQGGVSFARVVAISLASALSLSPWEASALVTTEVGQGYINQCEAEGVPIPFVVDIAGGNGWTKKGDLLPDRVADSEGTGPAEVHYWTHPDDSVCIALPRTSSTDPNQWTAIGVICQGKASGKACFFDTNAQKPKSQTVFNIQGASTLDFVGGAELNIACTSCHQGENAFIVHPGFDGMQAGDPTGFGTLDDLIPFLRPDVYYEPIHPATMPANPPPSTDLGCGGCHAPAGPFGPFPDLSMATANFCDILLWTVGEGDAASAKTMPVGSRPIPASMLPAYNELRAACGRMPLDENNPAFQNMSFDLPDRWVPSAGNLSLNTTEFTEGVGAVSVDASGYVSLTSTPFDSWFFDQIGDELNLDVYLDANGQPNPYWLGSVQLYVSIPGTGQVNQFLGHVELTPIGTGWNTVVFDVPSAIKTSLLDQQTNVRFAVAVNTPQGAPPVLLDNLRFAGNLEAGPPSPARGVTRYEFEEGIAWTGATGAIAGSETTLAIGGYNTPSALQVNFNGVGFDGHVFTQPVVSPEPSSIVKVRVFIPTGAPVVAIQPYVLDGNWVWSDSWNPDLPRDAWITLSVEIPSDAVAPFNELGLKVYTSEPYQGPIYVDAIEY